MEDKKSSNEVIGKRMLETAILLDESMIELLKVEVLRLKKLAKLDNTALEMQKTNYLVKNIMMALLINDEKIKTGMELLWGDFETDNDKNMP